ncbi:hypothetical protein BIY37_10275 [Candidatus Brocadia sapporoensis]|uniref:Uncharacterized protein n=1 Tax=Candidatus Brocadia sapporoensis TaxID=392547 RepID=A0A1V6LY57_9BACT|nr:helix-turn-helix domain-containing protein [Candidatus Brocadia sapporoensis]OQD45082.1 hypothetical protein BIY37_10275 [Candidatus Brocadia sapporoensis]GJQ24763.1 MAG: hypothetical protein HBSAPP01_25530 [Candidatus Brocadia sapporoensis]
MENQKEYEKRYQAIPLYKKGHGYNKILPLVQRSRGWLYKWLSRYKDVETKVSEIAAVHRDEFGEKFLDDWLNKILSLREELEAHKTR